MYAAGYLMQAVQVPAGDHVVRFKYSSFGSK
jgi:hypothetical protein